MSFLGYTQYALMGSDEPLEDHVAAVISVGPHDFSGMTDSHTVLWSIVTDHGMNRCNLGNRVPLAAVRGLGQERC